MLSEKSVNFAWVAHPSAKVTRTYPLVTKFMTTPGMEPPGPRRFFDLAAPGKPRPWSAPTAQGFWRDFVEAMDSNDGAQIAAFVQRRGDIDDELATADKICTDKWFNLYIELALLARCWGPEDADGVSRINAGVRVEEAEAWLRFAGLKHLTALISVSVGPPGGPDLLIHPNTLAGFMSLSAVGGFRRRVPMRRCRTCTSWYELRRAGNLYCSPACRVAHSVANRKKD